MELYSNTDRFREKYSTLIHIGLENSKQSHLRNPFFIDQIYMVVKQEIIR